MVGNLDFLPSSGQDLESPEGELHLRFYVPSENEFALLAKDVREVLSTPPDRITAIPNASHLLLGTLNWRGQVIWVADLGQFLGDAVALNTDRPEIPVIVIEEQDTMIGLAVERIVDMDWLNIAQMQMPTNVADSMISSFLKGEWLIDHSQNRYLRLLDQVAILRSARWGA